MTDLIEQPTEPGGFIGDIFYGHPIKSTMGTHRWDGAAWAPLPSEAEALMYLLAKARDALTAQAAEIARLTAERDEAVAVRKRIERRIHFQRVRLRQMEDFKYHHLRSIKARIMLEFPLRLRASYLAMGRNYGERIRIAIARAEAAERAAADAYARGLRDAANAKGWEQFIQDSAPSFLSDWQRGLVAGQRAMRSAILALIPKPATEG